MCDYNMTLSYSSLLYLGCTDSFSGLFIRDALDYSNALNVYSQDSNLRITEP